MIEDVEEFCTKFQGSPFANPGVLMKCKVPIIDPRSMEEAALCVSDAAQGLRREGGGMGTSAPLQPHSELSSSSVRVTGKPVLKRVIPAIVQPESNLPWTPWAALAKGRS